MLAESWPNGVGRAFRYSAIGAVQAELGLGDEMPLVLRSVSRINALGQPSEEWLGDPSFHAALRIEREQTAATGELESIRYSRRSGTGGAVMPIWQETYRYDGFGNLVRRGQHQDSGSFRQFEAYRYDALHRLTVSQLRTNGSANDPVELAYDITGNLRKKTDFSQNRADAYSYPAASAARPNAVQTVRLTDNNTRTYGYDASGNVVCQFRAGNGCSHYPTFRAHYNHNQQPVHQQRLLYVQNSIPTYSTAWFTYGADQQPARQWGSEGSTCQTRGASARACPFHHRIYLDRYEDTVGGFLHFDGSERAYRTRAYVGDSLVATRGRYGQLELSYLLRDRLGSVVGVETVRLSGRTPTAIVAETRHGFDAWGAPRSNRTWTAAGWREEPGRWLTPSRTQQGFTGHERLSGLQLIHMRGRVFDPQLGRFHGVDPIIQFSLSSQGLNPYGYILNNPMAGVDPTGYAICISDTECTISMREVDAIEINKKTGQVTLVVGEGDTAERYQVDAGQENRALSGFLLVNGAEGVQGARVAAASDASSIHSISKSEATLRRHLTASPHDNRGDPMRGAFLAGTRSLSLGITPLLMGEQDKADLDAYDQKVGAWSVLAAFSNPREMVRSIWSLGGKKAIARNADEVARSVTVSRSRFPESASHIEGAVSAGSSSTLTIDRAGATSRRRDALRGTESRRGLDRDEFPPAMFQEGGRGASVRHINPADNRGAGACIGAQCRTLPDGTRVRIEVVD